MSYTNTITLTPLNVHTDDQIPEIAQYKQEIERLRFELARAEVRASNSEQALRNLIK